MTATARRIDPAPEPHVSAAATERAEWDLASHLAWHRVPAPQVTARRIAEALATVRPLTDLVGLVGLDRERSRVVLRVYAAALDGWARVQRGAAGRAPHSPRDLARLADADASERWAQTVRERGGLV